MGKMTTRFQKLFWQLSTLVGIVILFASPITTSLQTLGMKHGIIVPGAVTVVNASEIYPMFTCPCCDNPLDKEKPCCGAATQMLDFIDQKVGSGASKDDVILATAQEFGLERLTNEVDRNALKETLIANAPQDAPKITVGESKRDLGEVSFKNGTVTTEFTITNEGKSELVVDKLSSSCGCTSGSVIYQGEEGPRFYMAGHGHDTPDPNWKAAIAPGDSATVKVYYDPTVHPDLTGPVTREVSVHTNDPVEFETKFTITLDQVK